MKNCPNCQMGFHLSCLSKSCECNQQSHQTEYVSSPTSSEEPDEPRHVSTRSTKRDATLKDQQSTGRKRAARMYPLHRDQPCEWQTLAECGGGTKPILGCINGLQQARHHGPDKSVSNNDEGNVHRICHACHNRWHAANNAEYDWNSTLPPSHKPRKMTDAEKEKAALINLRFLASKDAKKRIKD